MNKLIISLVAASALSACATVSAQDEGEEQRVRGPDHECDASGVQSHIGETATENLGATLLERAGAQLLRWIPPDTAVTMDFRVERLNISYDANMTIKRIYCG